MGGILYRNAQGVETQLAGLAPVGQMAPSVSEFKSGTFSVPATAVVGGAQTVNVVFDSPMADTDYEVTFSGGGSTEPWYSMIPRNKTVNGFQILAICLSSQGVSYSITYNYQAFRLMTDEVTALDEAKIEQNTANFAPNFSATASYSVGDYVTYNNVLYRCTVQHTASAWNASHFTAVNVGGEMKSMKTTTTGTGSIQSGVTIRTNVVNYAVANKVCTVSFIVDGFSNTTTQGMPIVTNLPAPKFGQEFSWADAINSSILGAYLGTEGTLYVYERTNAIYRVQMTYVCA